MVIHTIRPQHHLPAPKRKASGNSEQSHVDDELEFTFDQGFDKMFINEHGQKSRPQSSAENRERNPSRASGLSDESIEFILLPPPAQGIPGEGEISSKNQTSGNSGYNSIGSYGSNHHGSHSKSNHSNFKPPTPPSPPMQAPAPPSGPKITRAYHRRSGPIQKKKDTARMVMPAPTPLSPVEYEVDKIMDTRRHRGIKQYRVKWKGFGDDMNTWEPEANLADCKELLLAYRRAQQQENGTRTRTRRITQPQHAMKTLDIQKCGRKLEKCQGFWSRRFLHVDFLKSKCPMKNPSKNAPTRTCVGPHLLWPYFAEIWSVWDISVKKSKFPKSPLPLCVFESDNLRPHFRRPKSHPFTRPDRCKQLPDFNRRNNRKTNKIPHFQPCLARAATISKHSPAETSIHPSRTRK